VLLFLILPVDSLASIEGSASSDYVVLATIPAHHAQGIWDYATVDVGAGRLYLAQDGVTLLDLKTGAVTARYMHKAKSHFAVPIHSVVAVRDAGVIAVSDSSTNSVVFLHTETGRPFAMTRTGPRLRKDSWHDPDALVYDSATASLIAVNGDSGSLAIVDVTTRKMTGRVRIGGKLESAAVDGRGLLYVNEEEKSRIAVVDIVKRRVINQFALSECTNPTGIAYDASDQLIISVCSNGLAKFIATKDGREVASIKVGEGADNIVYDQKERVVFSPSGQDGTLSIISVNGASDIVLRQTVKTRIGSRLGALDPSTGNFYLPAARFGPPAPPLKLPGLEVMAGVNRGTFEFIVVGHRPEAETQH